MKKISITLIVIGMMVITYPFARDLYSSYWQNKMLKEFENHVSLDTEPTEPASDEPKYSKKAVEDYNQLQEVFAQEVESLKAQSQYVPDPVVSSQPETQTEGVESQTPKEEQNDTGPLGVLYIDKIDLKLPILRGSSAEVLKKGAGYIEGTASIGEIGNTAIAAHRSHTYGRNFNRLDEINVGDEFIIETHNKRITYRVFRKLVVEPTDLSVLKANKTDRVVTLITCHPLYTATHRLIVQAVAQSEK